ncbi:unnamed protein product [Vitrella brassicaformis CCMP3155]|uniref:C962R-like N-terminal AEP domain-containing protein n=1 Tax=Vitrella brassicaformis (strain CCMP3155) TaxID=1169540 RepID=A0A0G4EJL1_VITBC|nr:unnamed protein product [Vitrella brassicaformis CCMP3155]|eukprot:CEL96692.1 unnamed protein product [Vitrella brassicaformis CCMP3155]
MADRIHDVMRRVFSSGLPVGALRARPSWHRSASSFPHLVGRGFQCHEDGLVFFPTKEELLQAKPPGSAVWVGSSYLRKLPNKKGELVTTQKYSYFPSHASFWDHVYSRHKMGYLTGLYEVAAEHHPRVLYFDLDGKKPMKKHGNRFLSSLQHLVSWFFSVDDDQLEPVVLASANPDKFSVHVMYPQIQFSNYERQCEVLPTLLNAIHLLDTKTMQIDHTASGLPDTADGADTRGASQPELRDVVDRHPYMKFQLFRAPYACKLKGGEYKKETTLLPQTDFYMHDNLTGFITYVCPDFAAVTDPTMDQLTQHNSVLEEIRRMTIWRGPGLRFKGGHGGAGIPMADINSLYVPEFRQHLIRSTIDFRGLSYADQWSLGLRSINTMRASHFWSWFRLCGSCYTLMHRYESDPETRQRVLDAFLDWSKVPTQ